MSTIEEAREQARETLADYHRVNAGGYGAGNHTYLARALRAQCEYESSYGTRGRAVKCAAAHVTAKHEVDGSEER